IKLPAKRRPTEGTGRSLNGFGEIASAICRSGETGFVLHADRAGKRFFVTRRKQPGRAGNEKDQADETKDDRDRNTGTQFARSAQREAEQIRRGEGSAD